MNSEIIIKDAEENLLHVYNRFKVVFSHGEGVYLYDTDDKKYLDFASGIGVNAFGYADREYLDAIHKQADRLLHISNLYYSPLLPEAAGALKAACGLDKVFFTNSGAEAIEGALKTAKKYAYIKKGAAGAEVIAMDNSFHGRTVGALSVTGTSHYREPFYPLMAGVRFAEFNDLASVKAQLNDKTCAIILEPVQGEGGITPATKEFMQGVRDLCDKNNLLLILDEIQCGMGRTGYMYAYEHYGVKPDIVTTAKALGGGLPVGAFAVTNEVADRSLVPGDHGTTYGGNPLVLSGVIASINIMRQRGICEHVRELTPYLEATLDKFGEEFTFVKERRGMGFMQGLKLEERVMPSDIIQGCLDNGLVVLSAGGNVIRLLPPLVIEKEHIDEMAEKLKGVLRQI